jgi:hypothetical protein
VNGLEVLGLYILKGSRADREHHGRRWGGARGGVEGGGAHDSRGELFRICRGRKFIRRVHSPCPPPAGERQPGSGRKEMQWGERGWSIPLLASPSERGVAKDSILRKRRRQMERQMNGARGEVRVLKGTLQTAAGGGFQSQTQ